MKKIVTMLALIISIFLSVKAQKLPTIQSTSLTIPKATKIDGKADEWDNKFQAFNNATSIFYTLANNDKNLYLTVQSKEVVISKKILGGGITFTVNPSGKRNDNKSIIIQFPILDQSVSTRIDVLLNKLIIEKDNIHRDSIINFINNQLLVNEKIIKITGVKSIADSLISVYNTEGIKAIILLDNTGALTYEFMIPLKYYDIYKIKQDANLAYNIMLNGISNIMKTTNRTSPNGDDVVVSAFPKGVINKRGDATELTNPTDFWGYYSLSKNP